MKRNIRRSIISGLVRKRSVQETSYPKFHCIRHQTATATRNWPEQKYHLRNIRKIRGSIVSGLVRNKRRFRALLLCVPRSTLPSTHKCPAFCEGLGQCPSPSRVIQYLLVLRNARAFPLLPAALASVSFGFELVRVRVTILTCAQRTRVHFCPQQPQH